MEWLTTSTLLDRLHDNVVWSMRGNFVDLAVGFEFSRTVGERVEKGEPWCVIHARTEDDAELAARRLEGIVVWSEDPVETAPVITARLGD